MAALVAAIHVYPRRRRKDVDGRDKRGHDDEGTESISPKRGPASRNSETIRRLNRSQNRTFAIDDQSSSGQWHGQSLPETGSDRENLNRSAPAMLRPASIRHSQRAA
jgi:hypothetical protein